MNGAGDDGESVYGEKADIRLVFGDGIRGDFRAIIIADASSVDSSDLTVRLLRFMRNPLKPITVSKQEKAILKSRRNND